MKKLKFKRSLGQSLTEYAVLLAIVAAALLAMQVYVKRGIQGRIRDLADQISPTQYEEGRTDSSYETIQTGKTGQSYDNGISRMTQSEATTRVGEENVTPREE